jgi:dolichol-phosphate mannosyltransferase
MDSSLPSISIIMPAYNEEKTVESATSHNIETFNSLGIDFELLIVDDKSSDKTPILAKELAKTHEVVKFFHHEKNLGPGGAFRTGISHAVKDYVIFLPFDNPMDLEDLKEYLPRMGTCDIIVGVRAERVGYSKPALFASFIYNRILIPLFFNIGISDVNWIQVYRRNLFSDKIIEFEDSKIFYLVEILIKARINQLIIAEVPSKMKKRLYGQATCTKFSTILVTLWDFARFFIKIQRGFPK